MFRPILIALTLAGSAAHAQQSPLVGSWKVSYAAAVRMENGTATPIMGTGVLTITATGDSLFAELAGDRRPDQPARPPSRLAGPAGPGERTFIGHSTATMNINGDKQEVGTTLTWKLTATADSLKGSIQRKADGVAMEDQAATPIIGVRRNK